MCFDPNEWSIETMVQRTNILKRDYANDTRWTWKIEGLEHELRERLEEKWGDNEYALDIEELEELLEDATGKDEEWWRDMIEAELKRRAEEGSYAEVN